MKRFSRIYINGAFSEVSHHVVTRPTTIVGEKLHKHGGGDGESNGFPDSSNRYAFAFYSVFVQHSRRGGNGGVAYARHVAAYSARCINGTL